MPTDCSPQRHEGTKSSQRIHINPRHGLNDIHHRDAEAQRIHCIIVRRLDVGPSAGRAPFRSSAPSLGTPSSSSAFVKDRRWPSGASAFRPPARQLHLSSSTGRVAWPYPQTTKNFPRLRHKFSLRPHTIQLRIDDRDDYRPTLFLAEI
jgi:hypothetical protein